jgi:hypothetical protein
MKVSCKVLGLVRAGTKNSRVLLERVEDGVKATNLYAVSEMPPVDSVVSVEWDKCVNAKEKDIRAVALHQHGKDPGLHAKGKLVEEVPVGDSGVALDAEAEGVPIQMPSSDIFSGIETPPLPASEPSVGGDPVTGFTVEDVAPGLAEEPMVESTG